MYNILIWGTGSMYGQYLTLLKHFEEKQMFKIIAVTSNESFLNKLDGYSFVSKNELIDLNFDYCIVAMKNMNEMMEEAVSLGIPTEKLIPISVLSIPCFDFAKYIAIKESSLTIIAQNCIGTLCYHTLKLPFNSPTINMFFNAADYLKFISNLHYYLQFPLVYVQDGYDTNKQRSYPICRLDDLLLHFLHYKTFEDACAQWEKRKKRINYDNILYLGFTKNADIEREFNELPLKNKYIFVPYHSSYPKSIYIPHIPSKYEYYAHTITDIGRGVSNRIDILSLLNHDKDFIRTN